MPRTLVILLLLMAVAAGLRGAYVLIAVSGQGARTESPDGKLYAEFYSNNGPGFFGGRRYWTTFEIGENDGDVLWTHRIRGQEAQLAIRMDTAGVQWTPDSTAVTFTAPRSGSLSDVFKLTAEIDGGSVSVE